MSSMNQEELAPVAKNSSAPTDDEDHFIYWPLVLALGWPVVLVLVWTCPESAWLTAVLAVYLLWAASAFGAFIAVLMSIHRRTWRRAASTAVLPAVTLAVYFNGGFVVHVVSRASDDLQLLATLPIYSREISNLPHQEGPRVATFLWRDLNGFGLAFGYEFLVYDESDEIVLPSEKRSAAWKKNAGSDLECRSTGIFHAFGHNYFVGHGLNC